MSQIFSIIVGFILTGLVGNALVQSWQHRNWIRQQQYLGQEKEYLALRELSTEMTRAISKRLYKSRRLLWAVRSMKSEIMEERLREYDAALIEWNEGINAFYVQLTLYTSYADRYNLENNIHNPLKIIGSKIENAVIKRRAEVNDTKMNFGEIEKDLNKIQAKALNFDRDILLKVEIARKKVYFGEILTYDIYNIDKYSTWQLVKALFVAKVNTHAVVRPPSHFG